MKDVIGKNIDWGFGSGDIWSTSMLIVGSLAGFLLLGIVVNFSHTLFRLIKNAIEFKKVTGRGLTAGEYVEEFKSLNYARKKGEW